MSGLVVVVLVYGPWGLFSVLTRKLAISLARAVVSGIDVDVDVDEDVAVG